jgi:hypothetical protein
MHEVIRQFVTIFPPAHDSLTDHDIVTHVNYTRLSATRCINKRKMTHLVGSWLQIELAKSAFATASINQSRFLGVIDRCFSAPTNPPDLPRRRTTTGRAQVSQPKNITTQMSSSTI